MQDDETGLYYLRARYYDPAVERFISKDTYEGSVTNPLSLNLYTYVANNSLRYFDLSGHRIEQDKYLSKNDQKLMDQYTADFNKAKAAGNKAAMQVAHDKANALREANGFEIINRTDYSTGKTTSISTGKGGVREDWLSTAIAVPAVAAGIYYAPVIAPTVAATTDVATMGTTVSTATSGAILGTKTVATLLANKYSGKVMQATGNGWKVTEIANPISRNQPIMIRVMDAGSGGRADSYFRGTVGNKSALTLQGKLSNDMADTHILLTDNYEAQIQHMINQYIKTRGK
ncbi:RHS repeat-associated core domain-containing protein [Paenibacillus rubinfantis]|uniref:RHS repeat-associated core domain-containing protein n=1 Tax=Paenibacillus rubinfantis TaxID=1720296 RepID=UPI00073EFA29|nr:RHS repeat-associated core domain-containing protein [Paenibacillus rubinfantis]